MLTKIAIENFKGIRERVEFDLKPITLLFGANSAGKSTVLHALHYARELIVANNRNVTTTEIGGDHINLGGFSSFVHARDPARKVRLELTASANELWDMADISDFVPSEFKVTESGAASIDHFIEQWKKVKSTTICLEIYGEDITHYSAVIDDHAVGQIDLVNSTVILRNFAIDHPFIPAELDLNNRKPNVDDWKLAAMDLINCTEGTISLDSCSSSTSPAEILTKRRRTKGNGWLFDALPCPLPNRGPLTDFYSSMTSIDCQLLEEEYGFEVRAGYTEEDYNDVAFELEKYVDLLLVLPLVVVRAALEKYRHIGPLREIGFNKPQSSYSNTTWIKGEKAWEELLTNSDLDTSKINYWLGDVTRFDSGHQIKIAKSIQIEIDKLSHFQQNTESDIIAIKAVLDQAKISHEVRIVSSSTKTELQAFDVGVGISQVLPIVVACHDGHRGLTAIEQPELHLHPRLQVLLGDLFIFASNYAARPPLPYSLDLEMALFGDRGIRFMTEEEAKAVGTIAIPLDEQKTLASNDLLENANKDNQNRKSRSQQFILETHSEHLLLRLLRRIRETSRNGKPNDETRLAPEDLSVVFLEQTSEGATTAKQMKVTEDGDFVGYWPEGFFDERSSELY